MTELAKKYDPSEVEGKWYQYWLDHRLFHSEPDAREPYTVVIPPPNVTGVLHMGHMLNETIQDILVRRARMEGKNACWVPGTDHASIATEAKVVAKLKDEGTINRKTDLTREEFLRHAWDWTNHHGGIILKQLRRLGASCDWERTAFTMDPRRSEAVIRVFCELYRKGLIYRGVRMVNWDPAAQTALSDEEVEYVEEHSHLFHLRYFVEGEPDKYIVVATTRPETILGDTAVCVNPADPRYQWLKGKRVIVPLVGRSVPIIMDSYVEMDFGTGCLKVTPAHDVNDYMLGEKYNLPSIDIFNPDGTIAEAGGMYVGHDRFDVRREIMADLAERGLVEKVEDYDNKVGHSQRSHAAIEPKLSMQWFLKMATLTPPALKAVMDDDIRFFPPKFKNTYRSWMTDTKDWCISRQLWWGHRIPAYFLPEGGYVVAETPEKALDEARAKTGNPSLRLCDLRPDEDCLDTWFSSWLWPISLFDGIMHPHNKEIEYYYPTADLVTGPDIIFFWVARMIIAGYEFQGKMPFKNVYFTGIVRDEKGRKMSKSLGNSPDPIELMDFYGADGVRMGLMLCAPAGNDILFDLKMCETGRNFCNKMWNAYRLFKGWQTDGDLSRPMSEADRVATEWFAARLSQTVAEVDDLMAKFRLSEAMNALYRLFWDDFSAWFLEMVKPEYGKPVNAQTYRAVCDGFDALLRLLHPFAPFITEELWQNITPRREGESIMYAPAPRADFRPSDAATLAAMAEAQQIVVALRALRASKNLPPRERLTFYPADSRLPEQGLRLLIERLANADMVARPSEPAEGTQETGESGPRATFMVGTREFVVPLADSIDTEAERARLKKEIAYVEGFLTSVEKKLANERFVAKAPAAVIDGERRKQADAQSKLATLRASLAALG